MTAADETWTDARQPESETSEQADGGAGEASVERSDNEIALQAAEEATDGPR